jgi:hypothetical protein
MTWTHTTRGKALDLLDPQPGDVDLDEIALALGNQCRYAGGVRRFYSVAEHSVLIARWLRDHAHPLDVQLAGLLHDAAEAYTGDITYPMQAVLWSASPAARAAYREVQRKLDAAICALVHLDPKLLHCEAVKQADLRILLDERDELLGLPTPRPWAVEADGYTPLGVRILCASPTEARDAWAHTLRTLLRERGQR